MYFILHNTYASWCGRLCTPVSMASLGYAGFWLGLGGLWGPSGWSETKIINHLYSFKRVSKYSFRKMGIGSKDVCLKLTMVEHIWQWWSGRCFIVRWTGTVRMAVLAWKQWGWRSVKLGKADRFERRPIQRCKGRTIVVNVFLLPWIVKGILWSG